MGTYRHALNVPGRKRKARCSCVLCHEEGEVAHMRRSHSSEKCAKNVVATRMEAIGYVRAKRWQALKVAEVPLRFASDVIQQKEQLTFQAMPDGVGPWAPAWAVEIEKYLVDGWTRIFSEDLEYRPVHWTARTSTGSLVLQLAVRDEEFRHAFLTCARLDDTAGLELAESVLRTIEREAVARGEWPWTKGARRAS